MKYPLEKQKDWHTDQDYKKTGGKLEKIDPEEFLRKTRPLTMDKRDKINIKNQIKQIEQGTNHMEPLSLRADGTEDGRHRAVTAMIKGIKKVPVLTWPDRKDPDESIDKTGKKGKGVLKTIMKVVKKFRKNEKYK